MNLLDQLLWALAITLSLAALYLSRSRPRSWQPALIYRGILGEEGGSPPSEWLGAPLDWRTVREGGPELEKLLRRRLEGLRLLWVGPGSTELPGLELHEVEEGSIGAAPEQLAWEKKVEEEVGKGKVVVAAAGGSAMVLLRLLHDAPGLRDRCVAALLVEPELEEAWLKEHFSHTTFDTELNRVTPYLLLHSNRDSVRLTTPPEPATGRRAIEVVELPGGLGRPVAVLLAALVG